MRKEHSWVATFGPRAGGIREKCLPVDESMRSLDKKSTARVRQPAEWRDAEHSTRRRVHDDQTTSDTN